MKKGLISFLLVGLLIGLTACGQGADSESTKTSEPDKADADEAAYQALGAKLLKELEEKTAKKLTFFDVADKLSYQGYEPIENVSKFQKIEPCAVLQDSAQIAALKQSLQADKWQAKRMELKSMPKVFLYFDGDFHLNLETQETSGQAWMSINSPSGTAYYTVPAEVYQTILEKYRDAE